MRKHYKTFAILLLMLLAAGFALAETPERRIALVIGNSKYRSNALTNPENDARAMAQTLSALGFETTAAYNVRSYQQFGKLIQDFGAQIKTGGIALFYYAGHGVQVEGKNYLVPTNARINKESDVEFEAIDLDRVLSEMQNADNDLNIVILDACRDNPYSSSIRSGTRGLASIARSVPDCLIAYATQPNGVASDGDGLNGVFTEELLKSITTPGLSLTQIMMRVREGVKTRTNAEQIPWETSLLTRDFYFIPDAASIDKDKLNEAMKLEFAKNQPNYRSQKWIALSLVTADVLAAIYLKGKADSNYDNYLAATTNQQAIDYRDKTEAYDSYQRFTSLMIPLPLSWFVYCVIKDGQRK